MAKNHNSSNFCPNSNENSNPQTSRNRRNPQFPPNNAPFYPQYFQNNKQPPPFGWCPPPEYWSAMASQFFMPPPTNNHPPPPTFPSNASKKASANPSSTNNATTQQPPFGWCPPPPEYWNTMANQYFMPSNDSRKANPPNPTNNTPFNWCPPQYWPTMANPYFTPPPNMPLNESKRATIGKKPNGPPHCPKKDDEEWTREEDILLCKSFLAVSKEMEMERKAKQLNIPSQIVKKARTCESGEYNTSSSGSSSEADEDDSDDEFPERPLEQEAAKMKGKVNANPNLSILKDMKGQLDDRKVGNLKAKTQQAFKANAEENNSRANDSLLVREYEILMRNTEGMTEEQLKVHNHFCGIIRKKWGLM